MSVLDAEDGALFRRTIRTVLTPPLDGNVCAVVGGIVGGIVGTYAMCVCACVCGFDGEDHVFIRNSCASSFCANGWTSIELFHSINPHNSLR